MSTENINETEETTVTEAAAAEVTEQVAAENAAGNALANVLALRESNPKVFYGGLGGAVLLVLALLIGGGSDAKLVAHQAKPIVVGQSYVLKGANAYDPNATIRLVSVPGSMAAYDDTEENDREGSCKHIPEGTPVKLIQSQDAYGKKDVFAEVEMTSGECEGKRGWALSVNLQ